MRITSLYKAVRPARLKSLVTSCRTLCASVTGKDEKKEVPYQTLKDSSDDSAASVPDRCQAVVIGGGAVGCSTLYHLSKMGISAVLVEKDQLTSGTTWHTAGLLWRLRPNENEMLSCTITRNLMDSLEEETGVHSGFHMNGGLFIASTKERLDEYKRLSTFAKYMGVDSQILSPSESKELYPLLNTDDLVGTLYSPTDGHIDPAGYCTALTRAAKHNGAQVLTGTTIHGIQLASDSRGNREIKSVVTDKGVINTENVIVCAGCWANSLLHPLGIKIPQMTLRHSYVVTERMEGVIKMPSIRDHDLAIYLKVQGDVLQIGGYEPNPVILDDGIPQDFAFGLFELDWDAFGVHIERGMHRVPEIENSGIRSTVSGPEAFTPDGKPVMGPNPAVRGLYHNHGFNSGGVMLSGGAGKMLAQWIVDGTPELHVFDSDVRRFHSALIPNDKWVRERCHEYYTKHYSIGYHFDEPLSGRGVLKDVLYDEQIADGCFFQSKGGWERPGWFDPGKEHPPQPYKYYGAYGNHEYDPYPYNEQLIKDYTFDYPKQHHEIGAECLNARNKVNMFNMSYFGKFYVSGQDSVRAMEWIFSNTMNKEPGSTTYTCMLNNLGRLESDLTVSVIDDDGPQRDLGVTGPSFYVAVGGAFSPYILSRLQTEMKGQNFSCKIDDLSHDMVLLSLQGPNSRDLLSKLTDADLSNEAFPFSSHQAITAGGHKVRAMRLSFIGEMGWELHAPNHAAKEIYRKLKEAGSESGLRMSGYRAMDSLSMEKGYRMWHSDIRSDDSPLEADLMFTCKLKTDTPFLGREALERYKQEGIKKKLVCFTLPRPVALHGLEVIRRNGETAGYLRRSEFAFALNTQIAWGYVNIPSGEKVKDYVMSGKYQLDRMGEMIDANAHMRSPFDPKHQRLQGIY